ncbi:glutamate-5-semialdehyde dehydrogenase [Thermosulfidibacter takaii ABI70S6]|uniref:Gamma-glutamyl phosphate reductase n=1 Tax=Thermosulfidibacter takaii (strain DSM 17441 / JCM 13301 / NBRC 103674 / ABI70S6) TaxID=1298851 RepID=A0A0S3QSM3_THET7|nr:glutamate-5-semialdehyde dehydrogenase [Thermosulfidibacter takaii]BAT71347.1 glutamate-5-semialdehyde dehydrogenase [Thermosulfidibacter takaii ABI70S6]
MDVKEYVTDIAKKAQAAYRVLANLSTDVKDRTLLLMAEGIEKNAERIKEENKKDLREGEAKGLSKALLDRLLLNDKRIKGMADGLRQVASLPDPVGEVVKMWKRPNGLMIGKMRVPIGVVGVIYESRPNVTADTAGLCIKSGNAVLLRGGSEAINSNRVIVDILKEACEEAGVPTDAVSFIDTTDRAAVEVMLKLDQYIDLIVPRGGEGLIRFVAENSRIPVVYHYKGVCHTYVDKYADLTMAEEICFNAKVQRPGVCNAMETMLVHKDVAEEFLPRICERLKEAGVEIRGCPETRKIVPWTKEATEEDWYAEYLDLILAVKVVDSFEEAVEHINKYGSHHSDAIVTKDYERGMRFLREVDSAAVYVNASTRFTDGYEFGLGAEMGISTQKLHVRGPMGLEDLTCCKYVILGCGQIRE